MRRFLKNTIGLAVITAVIFAAYLWYSPGATEVKGITAEDKFHQIAKIVSQKHEGAINVVYLKIPSGSRSNHGFVVSLETTQESVTTQEKATELQNAFEDALATLLRLSTTEVLSTEPSISGIFIDYVGFDRELQSWYALAADLKALPLDAPDEAWIAKLKSAQEASSGSETSSGGSQSEN